MTPGPVGSLPADLNVDLEMVWAAALAHTGGGQVTDTEVGDDESYDEVEVRTDDGREIDVQLDEQFTVVSSHDDGIDDDGPNDDDRWDDDRFEADRYDD